ncbi:putative superfamily III holin-X [Micromonospora olivasterospora]|uniref:Putative superfamily III holin-X n=1 Tax=Micromonospora olivasterospora TaxID=1880 RepID=A0A562IEL1_MICOL|nr:putative superfamily III holin-X [Micromonospora olivasterospora]
MYGLGALVAAAILLLALVLPAWVAALVVAVVLFAVAGILALVGKKQVSQAVPPVPTATVRSVRADVDTVTAAVKDRGRA